MDCVFAEARREKMIRDGERGVGVGSLESRRGWVCVFSEGKVEVKQSECGMEAGQEKS